MKKLLTMMKNLERLSKSLLAVFFAVLLFHNLRGCMPPIPNVINNPQIREVINADTAQLAIMELDIAAIKSPRKKEINLIIDSYGGSVMDARRITNKIKKLKRAKYTVNCYVEKAFSAGFQILQYCSKRIGMEGAWYMQHRMHNGTERERMSMSQEQHVMYTFIESELNRAESDRMGIPLEVWEEMQKYGIWFNNEDACDENVIDAIEVNGEIVPCE